MKQCNEIRAILDSALLVNREKRKSSRIPLQAKVLLAVDQELVEGKLVNISLHGAFVVPSRPLEIHTSLRLTVLAPESGRSLTDLEARVVRVTDGGVGLEFDGTMLV